jgi:D-tyrosyl-tRNA(Tyr) deacylase
MRAVIQRVEKASVIIGNETLATIGPGLVVLVAIRKQDGIADIAWMKRKILNLRIFEDAQGRMNRSIVAAGGKILLVSQFTLFGDCRKGNRPSYSRAAPPEQARQLYDRLLGELEAESVPVASGRFQAMMQVELINSGPVTLILDSDRTFY